MKGHKENERRHRKTGGVNEAEMDLKVKPSARVNAPKVDDAAEERACGGPVKGRHKRKSGGALHKANTGEGFGPQDEPTKRARGGGVKGKHVGDVEGEGAKHHAGRKPRARGGKAASDTHPFTSAAHGQQPKGRKLDMEMDGV
jgi:hypothetical protein